MKVCCVEGCGERGEHGRTFTIAGTGWGDAEVDAYFCCLHLDMLGNEVTPCLDLRITGKVRA